MLRIAFILLSFSKYGFFRFWQGQLHLLGLANEATEQTHVFDLYLPGTYATSLIDNVLVLHNVKAKVQGSSN